MCQGVATYEGKLSKFRIDGFDAERTSRLGVYNFNDSRSTINNRSAGPMARRLTTNQEIAGSIPASIKISSPFKVFLFCNSYWKLSGLQFLLS